MLDIHLFVHLILFNLIQCIIYVVEWVYYHIQQRFYAILPKTKALLSSTRHIWVLFFVPQFKKERWQ